MRIEFAAKMAIESCDRDPGTAILLAESKLDGAPLGTMRIQTNEYAPLAVEQSVRLPDSFPSKPCLTLWFWAP